MDGETTQEDEEPEGDEGETESGDAEPEENL